MISAIFLGNFRPVIISLYFPNTLLITSIFKALLDVLKININLIAFKYLQILNLN